MDTKVENQSQLDLFPESRRQAHLNGKSPSVLKDFTLSAENMIVLIIVLLMVIILFFSFGVEKGKKISDQVLPSAVGTASLKVPEKINLVKKGENAILLPSADGKAGVSSPATTAVKPLPTTLKPGSVSAKVSILGNPKAPSIAVATVPQEKLSGFYTVQLASFKLEKYAQDEVRRLEKTGQTPFILPKGSHSIVCVGKFAKKNEAQKIFNNLKNKYKDCLVRRL